jgi:phosphoglycolate phosphatase-like HAD superfamily hydrolase
MEHKIIIFDIDGTLSNCEHRRHFAQIQPPNWDAFNAGCFADPPYEDILWLNHLFSNEGCICLITSARSDGHTDATINWLTENDVRYNKLYMRKEDDTRSDYVVKSEILELIRKEYGEPYMAVDDRDAAVKCWRDAGIRTLQVAYGDF